MSHNSFGQSSHDNSGLNYLPGHTPGGGPVQPWNRRSPRLDQQLKNKSSMRTGMSFAIGYVVVIWVVHLLNVISGGLLSYYGIHPLDTSSLWHIVTAPLLHASWEHLISNTIPGAVFCFILGLSGKRAFWEVTLIVTLIAGLGTWFFGGVGTNHIGASGLIYGWLGYLLVRGIFNRDLKQFLVGVVLAVIYSGLFWGLLPIQRGVSWQGHLFGALGGVAAGAFISSDDPAALKERRRRKKLQKRNGGGGIERY